MYLEIKNVGAIKNAKVEINGLTVIAGENDTGKSTVGKTLFCAVKSISMSSGNFFIRNRTRYISKLFYDMKSAVAFTVKKQEDYQYCAKLLNDIEEKLRKNIKKYNINKTEYKKIISLIKNDEKISKIPFVQGFYEKLIEVADPKYRDRFIANNFQTILGYAFADDYFNHNSKQEIFVKVEDEIRGSEFVFRVSENENRFSGNKIFDDAVFIDTPVIFQLLNLLNDASLKDKEYSPTIKDLKNKLIDLPKKTDIWEKDKINRIIKNIQNIIEGDFEDENGIFKYVKRNGDVIKIENTATGIKSFGLLLLLLKKGWLRQNTILVFDEPEVHLHPKWQLKMAKVILELSKAGVKVVVNSHSPYLIQAIRFYASDHEYEDVLTDFYLTRKDNEVVKIECVNNKINKIFNLLAEPINEVF